MRALLLVGLVTALLAVNSSGKGGRGIPIVYGSGDHIVFRGELPDEVGEEMAVALGEEADVGFIYQRFHIFHLDFWRSKGRFVLYSGDQYWEFSAREWRAMLGKNPQEKYGKPTLYHIPLGYIVLGTAFGGWLFWGWLSRTEAEKIAKLARQPRYKEALKTLFPQTDSRLVLEYEEEAFATAASRLQARGVSRRKSVSKLRLLADARITNLNAHIDIGFDCVRERIEHGDYQKARQGLEELIDLLPESDSRRGEAVQLLAGLPEPDSEADPDDG